MSTPKSTPRPNVAERRLKLAKDLIKKHGAIPSPWTLIKMKHGGLYRYMLRNAKLFEGLPQVSKLIPDTNRSINISVLEKHLKTARRLVKKLGSLPDRSWLDEHGYNTLAAYIKNHPSFMEKLDDSTDKNRTPSRSR